MGDDPFLQEQRGGERLAEGELFAAGISDRDGRPVAFRGLNKSMRKRSGRGLAAFGSFGAEFEYALVKALGADVTGYRLADVHRHFVAQLQARCERTAAFEAEGMAPKAIQIDRYHWSACIDPASDDVD